MMQPCVRVISQRLRRLAFTGVIGNHVTSVTGRSALVTKQLAVSMRCLGRYVGRGGRPMLRLRRRHLPDLTRRRPIRTTLLELLSATVRASSSTPMAAQTASTTPASVLTTSNVNANANSTKAESPKKKTVRFSRFERVFEAYSPSDYDRSSVAPRYEALLAWRRMSASVRPHHRSAVSPQTPVSPVKHVSVPAYEPMVASHSYMTGHPGMTRTVAAPAGAAVPVHAVCPPQSMLPAEPWVTHPSWTYASSLSSPTDLFAVPYSVRSLTMQR